jgi:hypothetical protein
MNYLIDIIVLAIWLAVFISCGSDISKALGGALIFSLFLPFIYLASYKYKRYRNELSFAGIIILTLFLTNYVDYLDKVNKIPFVWIVILFFLVSLTCIIAFIILSLKPFQSNSDQITKDIFVKIRIRSYERLALFPILALIVFCIPTAFPYFIHGIGEDNLTKRAFLNYVPICISWLSLSFVFTLISLWKIKESINLVAIENTEIKFQNYNSLFLAVAGLLIILGSGFELVRGDWILWTATMLLFLIIFASLLTFWKFILNTNNESDITESEMLVPSFFEFRSLIIIIILYTILGSFNLLSLSIILMP